MMLFAILHDESAVRTLVAIKSVVIKQLIVPFRVSCLLSNIFLVIYCTNIVLLNPLIKYSPLLDFKR